MVNKKKTGKPPKIPSLQHNTGTRLEVDERGEPVISVDDPEVIPAPEENLETTSPYEPPPPAEGP